MVKQILAFSRRSEQKMMPVRFQQVIEETLHLVRATIPANIEIHQDIQGNCGMVMADSGQLHQIVMNLVTNAFHAVEKSQGTISVQFQEVCLEKTDVEGTSLGPGRHALLSVNDTGCGMDPEVMDRIFDPYFTTKKLGKGTGLGLSVVYGIVRDHKGDIRVFSKKGGGARFLVHLPLISNSSPQPAVETEECNPRGHERILLVDDEEPITRLGKQVLQRLGYRVTAHNGSLEALEVFEKNPRAFDLVITDMSMPKMTGDQLAKKLKAIRPGIPIIICTGFSGKVSPARAQAMGINGYLMKPIVISELAGTVRKVLDEHGPLPRS